MPSQPRSGQATPGRSKKSYPTPDKRDTILSDAINGNLGNYLDLVSGTQHPDHVNFTDHRLLREIPVDWETVARVYGKDRRTDQTYNGQIEFLNDSKDHPVFTRDFLIRRSEYHEKDVKMLTILDGLVRPTVTAPGAGYTQETVRVVLFGGVGSGGKVVAIVSAEGEVIGLQVTELGHYTIPPKLEIRDSGTGVGATGEVFIQPRTALLTKEELVRMQDDPLDSLYVLVRRTYTTLPGEWIYDSRDDLLLGPVQRKRRAVAVEDPPQQSSLTVTSKTVYDSRDESAFVAWEIVESYSDGTGSDGNPTFPILYSRLLDPELGPIARSEQIVIKASQVASLTIDGSTITKKTYEELDEFHYKEVIEVWSNSIFKTSAAKINLRLPDTLTALTSTFNSSAESGNHSATAPFAYAQGSSVSLSASTSSRSQSGAAITPDLQPAIHETDGNNLDCTQAKFFLVGNYTTATLLAVVNAGMAFVSFSASTVSSGTVNATAHGRSIGEAFQFTSGGGTLSGGLALNTAYYVRAITNANAFVYSLTLGGAPAGGSASATITVIQVVAPWPVFKPQSHTFTLKAQQASVTASADAHVAFSLNVTPDPNEGSLTYYPTVEDAHAGEVDGFNQGYSKSVATPVRTQVIKPTIHGTISSIGGDGDSDTTAAAARARARMPSIELGGDDVSPELDSDTGIVGATVEGSILPTSLAATVPPYIPTAGYFLVDVVESQQDFDYTKIKAFILNASIFA